MEREKQVCKRSRRFTVFAVISAVLACVCLAVGLLPLITALCEKPVTVDATVSHKSECTDGAGNPTDCLIRLEEYSVKLLIPAEQIRDTAPLIALKAGDRITFEMKSDDYDGLDTLAIHTPLSLRVGGGEIISEAETAPLDGDLGLVVVALCFAVAFGIGAAVLLRLRKRVSY